MLFQWQVNRRMKWFKIPLGVLLLVIVSMSYRDGYYNPCYIKINGAVYLQYFGGYPKAKKVHLKVLEADYRSFKYIKGSLDGSCQAGKV